MEDRLALLAHELRSPVAALAAIAAVAAGRRRELDDPTRRRLLRLALAAGRDVERIAFDVAPESLQLSAVDPGELVRDAVESAGLAGAPVRAQVEAGLPQLRGDAVRLRQALANLIGNALAHSAAEGDVIVTASAREDAIELAVADAGEGIAPERRELIFLPGVRFGERAGDGVGLAIAQAVAEAHGGRIELESAPGAGSTFRLVLPPGAAGA
jgi:signal transduction histidine kinase